MRSIRLSLTDLLAIVGCCAIGFAGLLYASSPWAQAAFSVAVGTLTLAWVAAIYRRGERRAFWVGFLLCGWAYLTFSYVPWFSTAIGQRLATTKLLKWAYPALIPAARRAENRAASQKSVEVLAPELETGMDPNMADVDRVDVLIRQKAGATLSPMAQGVSYETMKSGGMLAGVYLQLDPAQSAALSQARADGGHVVLHRERSGPLARAWSDPPIAVEDFFQVGHAGFALLAALVGGLAGRSFHATRDLGVSEARPSS